MSILQRTIELAAGIAVAACTAGWSAARAELATPWTELHASRVRLIAGPAGAMAGRFIAGIDISLADGWKTYWRVPGNSGVPPYFDWQASTNVAGAKVLYPAPARLPEALGEAIGYKHSVTFPVEITLQDPGKATNLDVTLEFGVCREICIPARAKLSLAVPASGAAGPPSASIAKALASVPRPQSDRRTTDPELIGVTATFVGSSPQLSIEARFPQEAKSSDLFIEAPDGLYVPMAKKVGDATGGTVRFEVDLSRVNAQELKGKALLLTLVSDTGSVEAAWTSK